MKVFRWWRRERYDPNRDYAGEGRNRIDAWAVHGAPGRWFMPGNGRAEWFKDDQAGPEMVVLPAGEAVLGSDLGMDENSRHIALFRHPFAISRFAVTFREWDAAGLPYRPEDKGWGRGRRPVVNVSYDDAQEYVGWLSAKTGKRYRLPSADEWEYAARAGTTTDYWWGHDIAIAQANYDPAANQILGAKKERGKGRGRTLPVDHFKPNPWGLYQVHGNVSEWCEPQKAEPPPLCGGCFASASYTQRSANRNSAYPPTTLRVYTIGFRVARTLVNTVDDITNVTADEARVINTLRQLCDAYMRNDKLAVEKLEPIATQIGKDLNDRGGLDEMRRVFHQLNGMPGSRTLEMHWNGIGQWMG